MKASLLFLSLALHAGTVLAQGPLTPPGAPAPMMKSLDQVEARAIISASPAAPVAGPHFTITTPGSYYLTGNVTVSSGDAIRITADDVTLDLNGFKISSALTGGVSGYAISAVGDRERLTIRNGSIVSGTTVTPAGVVTAAGFQNGIYSSNTIRQALVEGIHVSGIANHGIYLDGQGIVRDCTVRNCGGAGIRAQEVSNCSAELCIQIAINANNITNSSGSSINGTGVAAGWNVTNCNGTSTNGTGISCGGNVSNSSGTSTNGTGLACSHNASNCEGSSSASGTTQAGLMVNGTASFCRGFKLGGVAIRSAIAIGCTVTGGTVDSPQKFLGTP